MTEAFFPIALHQDPRYFVKGRGGFWKRTGYAMSREVVTLGDGGHAQFNVSEIGGNAVAAGISNLYYPAADRSVGNTLNKWGQQLALDTFFNVTKSSGRTCGIKSFGNRRRLGVQRLGGTHLSKTVKGGAAVSWVLFKNQSWASPLH